MLGKCVFYEFILRFHFEQTMMVIAVMVAAEVYLFDAGTERIEECICQRKGGVKSENVLKIYDEAKEWKFLYCTAELGDFLECVFPGVLVFDGQGYRTKVFE